MESVYLTIGSVWKAEDDYAQAFVDYHRHVGVQRFVIYDREYNRIAKMFEGQLDVIVKHFEDTPSNLHSHAWAGLIGDCQTEMPTTWLALIDADQVLVPVQTNDMKEVLRNYEDFASLQLNWHTFGSSGHKTKTDGSLYERFTMRARGDAGINHHTQTICQPKRSLAVQTADPHHIRLPLNEISVNTNKHRVIGPFSKPPAFDVAWIAHYITKSKEEWAQKNAKSRCDIWNEKMPFTMFDDHNAYCNEEKEERVKTLWDQAQSTKAMR